MFAELAISSALFAGSLAARLGPTPSTPDATITPGPSIELLRKQNNAKDIGWLLWSGTWGFESCQEGGTYYETASQWGCCTTASDGCASTDIPIGCISGSLIYPYSGTELSDSVITWPCTSVYTAAEDSMSTVCNTIMMFENDRDNSPLTNVNCGTASDRWSYYREKPAAAMTTSSDSSSGLSSQRITPSGSTPTSEPSSAVIPNNIPPEQTNKSESKAWIAGAVVGPIVGLALIGLIAWLFIRRRKKKTQYQPAATAEGPPAPSAAYAPGPNSPPQFYPPPMQQNAGAVPFGVAIHDSWAPGQQQSAYGTQQQWQDRDNLNINQAPMMGGQPGYGTPSPSMSPHSGYAQPAQYDTGMYKHEAQPVQPLDELEGSTAHTQPMSELPGAPIRTQ